MDYSDQPSNPLLFFPPSSQLQANSQNKIIGLKKKIQGIDVQPTEYELVEYILFKKRLSDLKKELDTGTITLPQAMENLKVICRLFTKTLNA